MCVAGTAPLDRRSLVGASLRVFVGCVPRVAGQVSVSARRPTRRPDGRGFLEAGLGYALQLSQPCVVLHSSAGFNGLVRRQPGGDECVTSPIRRILTHQQRQ